VHIVRNIIKLKTRRTRIFCYQWEIKKKLSLKNSTNPWSNQQDRRTVFFVVTGLHWHLREIFTIWFFIKTTHLVPGFLEKYSNLTVSPRILQMHANNFFLHQAGKKIRNLYLVGRVRVHTFCFIHTGSYSNLPFNARESYNCNSAHYQLLDIPVFAGNG
jgi:hypothetical protein